MPKNEVHFALHKKRQRSHERGEDDRAGRLGRPHTRRLPRGPHGQCERALLGSAAGGDAAHAPGTGGIVGYCWGATVSAMAAARVAGLAGGVCYYGGGIPNTAGERPECPVMFHWGATDQSIPIEAA